LRKLLFITLLFLASGMTLEAQSVRPTVNTTDQPKVRLYPNPATTYVQVDWNAQLKPAKFVVVNGVTGKQMLTGPVTSNTVRLEVSNYVTGLYVFRLFSANGSYISGITFQVSK